MCGSVHACFCFCATLCFIYFHSCKEIVIGYIETDSPCPQFDTNTKVGLEGFFSIVGECHFSCLIALVCCHGNRADVRGLGSGCRLVPGSHQEEVCHTGSLVLALATHPSLLSSQVSPIKSISKYLLFWRAEQSPQGYGHRHTWH